MNQRNDPLPRDVRPPDPPDELRCRTLASAHAAMATGQAADPWHRVWINRPLRLTWAATIAGLLIGHLLIGADPPATPVEPALPVTAAVGDIGELAEVIELGRCTVELPGWEIATASTRPPRPERTSS